MKRNSLKAVLFIGVLVTVMFIALPMASAYDYPNSWWKMLIRGEYTFSGSGACTVSPTGFTNFAPNEPGLASMGPNFWAGVYTFNPNGTGKMESHQVYQEGPPAYGAGAANLSWEFKYEMDGPEITFTFIEGTYSLKYTLGGNVPLTEYVAPPPQIQAYFDQPWTGRISPDGRTIFVFYGVPMKLIIPELFGIEIICQGVHQGFKTHSGVLR